MLLLLTAADCCSAALWWLMVTSLFLLPPFLLHSKLVLTADVKEALSSGGHLTTSLLHNNHRHQIHHSHHHQPPHSSSHPRPRSSLRVSALCSTQHHRCLHPTRSALSRVLMQILKHKIRCCWELHAAMLMACGEMLHCCCYQGTV